MTRATTPSRDYHHVVAHRLAGDRTIGYTMDLSTQLLEQAKPDHVVGVLVLDLNDGLDRTNA